MCVCLRPPFLDDHRSDLIETCQEYCWGPADVRFQRLILIGQAVPKLRPFICQPMTRHGAMTSRMTSQWRFIYLFIIIIFFAWLTVRSHWNLPGILPGPRGCAFSRFHINRTSGSQVTAIYMSTNDRTRCYDVTNDVTINVYLIYFYFFARLTSQFFFFFVWYDVTIDTADLSMCLFKVWYRSSSSISAVSQVFLKVWKLFFPKVWINCSNY